MHMCVYTTFVFLFLTYFLCVIGSRFIYLIRTDSDVLLFMTNIPLFICTSFFIHLSVGGHLVYFHVLAIINSAAVNTGVPLYLFKFWFPQNICPVLGLWGHMAVLFLVFWGISMLPCIVNSPLFENNSQKGTHWEQSAVNIGWLSSEEAVDSTWRHPPQPASRISLEPNQEVVLVILQD